MQTTSDEWKTMWSNPLVEVETKISIAGVEYFHGDIVQDSLQTSGGMYTSFDIGNCSSRQIDVKVFPKGTIPKQAEIRVYIRLMVPATEPDSENTYSEWIPQGVFFISTREENKMDGSLTIHGFDAMRKAGETWLTADYSLDNWPMSEDDVVADIASRMGVEIDSRTTLLNASPVDYPVDENGDMAMIDVLEGIAIANAGNWIMSEDGKLLLVSAYNNYGTIKDVSFKELDTGKSPDSISKVVLVVDSNNQYTYGDDNGRTIEKSIPWGSSDMASVILFLLVFSPKYNPFTATGVIADPALEIGDAINIGGTSSVVAQKSITYGRQLLMSISAPINDEIEDEYPYQSRTQRESRRQEARTRSAIEKSSEEIKVYVEDNVTEAIASINVSLDGITQRITDGEAKTSEIETKVDGIRLETATEAGEDGQVYARITLMIGPNSYSGFIKLEGNVDVSGQLSADALYAAMGDIADLTVNRLSTSRRIVLYLAKDRNDDNYVRVQDQYIEFVTGTTDGTTEQAETPNGLPLYWEADPNGEGVNLGGDGYPYLNGDRIFTTTAKTEWPVKVYSYTEQVKRSIGFEKMQDGDDTFYVPVDIFGAGAGGGSQQGRLVKKGSGLELIYTSSGGRQIGFRAGDGGYLDLYGLRKTTGLDFSGWDDGAFTETVEGVEDPYSYLVEFDSQNRPIKITDDEGKSMEIKW